MVKARPNGLIVFEGPSALDGTPIVVVITGFARKSRNRDTGDMLQVWILQADEHPLDARANGRDHGMCGDCPIKASCYVQWENAPSQIWKAYQRGSYPRFSFIDHSGWLMGRKLRLGACGEPTAMPVNLVNRLLRRCDGWTGYTHQWARFSNHKSWKRILMASVESVRQALVAQSLGWRTFRIGAPGSDCEDNEAGCPKAIENGQVTTCEHCLLCRGSAAVARNVMIWAHGGPPKLVPLVNHIAQEAEADGSN